MKLRNALVVLVCGGIHLGCTSPLDDCTGVDPKRLEAAIWDSIPVPLRMSRDEFLASILVADPKPEPAGREQESTRCSAVLRASSPYRGEVPFLFSVTGTTDGKPILKSVLVNYQRGFLPLVMDIDQCKFRHDLDKDVDLRKEHELAQSMVQGEHRENLVMRGKFVDKFWSVAVPQPMLEDLQILEERSSRTPEEILDALRNVPMRFEGYAFECCDHDDRLERKFTYKAVVEFVIQGDGSVTEAKVVSSNTGKPKIDSSITKEAKLLRFPPIEGKPVRVRYTMERKSTIAK